MPNYNNMWILLLYILITHLQKSSHGLAYLMIYLEPNRAWPLSLVGGEHPKMNWNEVSFCNLKYENSTLFVTLNLVCVSNFYSLEFHIYWYLQTAAGDTCFSNITSRCKAWIPMPGFPEKNPSKTTSKQLAVTLSQYNLLLWWSLLGPPKHVKKSDKLKPTF